MKLGSLFDGSGTCPLAARMCGIEPVWASEIEPFPIRVTRKNFPEMRHLGDITKINGAEIDPVDIITFGSPCQDLSVAGKGAGIIEGKRSSLFFEAIRIIKEMRGATNGKYPRYAMWENVPGALSSGKGRDFLEVLRAFAGVAGDGDDVPAPEGKGDRLGWSKSGCIMGDGYSIAWRQLDAQYWGVPQRRKRIYLVADFGGQRAGEILFERESMRGDSAKGREARQGTADDAAGGVGGSDCVKCLNPWDCQSKRIYQPDGVFPTLPAMDCGGANNQAVLYALDSMPSNSVKSSNPHSGFHEETVAKTLRAGGVDPTCNQGGNVIVEPVYALQGNGIDRAETAGCNGRGWQEDVRYTLNTIDRPAICFKPGQGAKARTIGESEKTAPTLASEAGGNSAPGVCYPNVFHTLTALNARNPESAQTPNCVCYPRVARTLTAEADASPCVDRGQNVVCYEAREETTRTPVICAATGQANAEIETDKAPTIIAGHEHAYTVYYNRSGEQVIGVEGDGNFRAQICTGISPCMKTRHPNLCAYPAQDTQRRYIVRRLTPLECCRLQGFPDDWTDGVEGSDTAKNKMWGNGMALPCVLYVMQGIKGDEK